jgi:hypothetical protein
MSILYTFFKMSSIKFACHKNRLLATSYHRHAGAAKREGGSLLATISSAALDSGRWSLDLLLRALLKYQ